MIFRSPFPEIQIPERPFTPFILERAALFGSKPALIDAATGNTVRYSELPHRVHSAARRLLKHGFQQRDVAAIYSPNCPEYALVFHGACLLGGIVTTVNPLYTASELKNQLNDAKCEFLLVPESSLEKAKEAVAGTTVRHILTVNELTENDEGSIDLPETQIHPREDLAALPYSSGTTGFCKGVMLTHYNLVANVLQFYGSDQQKEDDVLLCVLPMFHIYGLIGILNVGLYAGATIVTMPRFDLEEYLRNIEKYRVTFAHVVPPMVLALAQNTLVDRYNVSSLRRIFCAAAPLSASLLHASMKRIGCLVKQGYGMTEASPATHMCPDQEANNKHGSVGVCVANTECKVVDPATGKELGAHQEGDLHAWSANHERLFE